MKPVLIAVLFCLIGTTIHAQRADKNANHRVDTFIKARMQALGIPGMAVAVIKNGKVIKQSCYGIANMEWNRKVGPHSVFQVASVTKLLTSTLLLRTIAAGRIGPDDPVSAYIDSIPAAWKPLKIKHLVTHSSGLREFRSDNYAPVDAVVRALKDSTLEYYPGTGQHYAQSDFMLLGFILEKIYDKPYTELLRDEVAGPLQMDDGGYDMEQKVGSFLRTRLLPEKVTTYYETGGTRMAYKFSYPQFNYTAGGYFASITDMARWAVGLDKETIVDHLTADSLVYERDSLGSKLSDYTRAGWIPENENGIRYVGHSGGPGLADGLRFPDQGYTLIVLCNDGEILPYFARAIAAFYIKELSPRLQMEKFER